MKVHTVRVVTDSFDTYVWVYDYKPSRREILTRLYEVDPGMDLQWYEDTTSVYFDTTDVVIKGE